MTASKEEAFSPEVEEQLEVLMSGVDLGDDKVFESMRRELGSLLAQGRPLTVYLGADPTAPNIHLGHTVVMNKLAHFQQFGHRVVFLVGDFTALIGDPTGRSKTRPALSPEEVATNAATYTEQAFKQLDRDKTEVRFNSEWLKGMDFTQVIRHSASQTLAQVLVRDDFRKRFESGTPIHLHEFLYSLAQGIDAIELKTDVQVGGTDQFFNIMAGRDIMKHAGLRPQVALTLPILPGTDGKVKMSKSMGNDIGLTCEPADMYGKLMSIPDEAMPEYFRLASGLPPSEAEAVCTALESRTLHPREAKAQLARTIVSRWHGDAAGQVAEQAFVTQFTKQEVPQDIPELEVPPEADTVLALVLAAGVHSSKGEARRLIEGGGVSLDGERLADWKAPVPDTAGKVLKLGKRRLFRLLS